MTSKSKSKKKYYEPKEAFIERMRQLLPNEKDFNEYLKFIKIELPRSIRCNTLKISSEKLKERLEKNYNWIIKQPFKDFPEIMIVEGKIVDEKLLADTMINKEVNSKNTNNNPNNQPLLYVQPIKKSFKINNSSTENRDEVRLGIKDNANLFALNPGELGRSLEHMLGYYYIQEIASMLPVLVLDPKPNETILDLCASPGSKTTQIASRMQNTGTLIANEVSQGRINILSANLSRCGCTNVIITKKDGMLLCKELEKINEDYDKTMNMTIKTMLRTRNKNQDINNQTGDEDSGGRATSRLGSSHDGGGVGSGVMGTFSQTKKQNFLFDKILVDAPCSGEGTIRSTPSTNKMWNQKTITRLSKIQKNLVTSALKILKPGGTLVYSTCTHAPEENEAILDCIKKEFDVKIEPVTASLPKELKTRQGITEWEEKNERFHNSLTTRVGGRGVDGGTMKSRMKDIKYNKEVKNACRIYPQDNNTEGFFISKIKKN